MGTSYSKLRHIQEANLRLEQEHLFELRGNYKAKRAGTKANIQARLQNVAGATKLMQNPKLQGLLAQVKSRKSTLDKQLTYLNTELNNVLTEVEQLKTTRPDFAAEAGQLETVIKTYQTAIATMLEAGKPIETFAYQAAPTTTTQTTQTQQTTEKQPPQPITTQASNTIGAQGLNPYQSVQNRMSQTLPKFNPSTTR